MVVDDRLIATKSVEVDRQRSRHRHRRDARLGSGRLCDRRPLPADGHRRRSACPAAPSGSPGPASTRPTATCRSLSIDAPDEMRPRQNLEVGLTLANLPAGTRGLRHARRRRSRHPEPHPLRDARSGGLLFRPAAARHVDPRPLQPADRPHAGRARRGALRRRRGRAALRRARRRPRRWSPSIPAS